MADNVIDFELLRGDPVTVTFNDASTLTGDFYRWFPQADGVACAIVVPQGAASLADVTGIHYFDSFRHILKLTPTTP